MDGMTLKIIMALGLLGLLYGMRWIKLMNKGSKYSSQMTNEEVEALANRQAPFRSAEDYWQATEALSEPYTSPVVEPSLGQTVISGFAGSHKYVWDGKYLSAYAGQRLLQVEGDHISDFAGNRKFTWKNDCLSIFAGKKLFIIASGLVSVVGEGPLYRYDEKSISEFAGMKVLSIKGDLEVPEVIIGVLIVMIRNFVDME